MREGEYYQEGCMATGIKDKVSLLVEWAVSLGITFYLALGVINTYIVVMES